MNIGTLAVSVVANTEKFTKGMQKASAELQAFSGKMATYGSVVAGAALTGLGVLVHNSLESIDATAKLSDRLGITTEQLTGFQHAAEISGVSSESLSNGLQKLMKNLNPGEDPTTAILDIADTIQGMKDPVERAQFAMEKFGKSGQELIPMLLGGAESLRAMIAENERLAGSFSRLDAAKVEAANDAVTNLWKVFKGIGNTLAVEVAPFIELAAKSFTDWATSGDGLKKNTQNVFDSMTLGMAKVLDYLDFWKSGFYRVGDTLTSATIRKGSASK